MYKKEKVVIKIKVIYTNKPINAKKEGRFVTGKAISLLCALVVVMLGVRVFCSPDKLGSFEDAVAVFSPEITDSSQNCFPVSGGEISSEYSARVNPLDESSYEFHRGVDIASNEDDNIYAFADGKVSEVGEDASYGKYFSIVHSDGSETFYAHCNEIFVNENETVKCGQAVATVGETGQTTGKHLHFEMRINGKTVNPAEYLECKR